MPHPAQPDKTRADARWWRPALLLPVLLLLFSLLLTAPVIFELVRTIPELWRSDSGASLSELYLSEARVILLARSLLVAGAIGLMGVCLGIPMARIIAARKSRRSDLLVALLIAPIWLPSTMIYAAGNLLRAPDTMLGRALIEYSTSSESLRWVTIWTGYAVAVLGLALWSAPIAGVLIASGLGRRSGMFQEMIALEPVGAVRRGVLWIRIHLRVLVRAWVLIAIVMLGSAAALHLAQFETWSIVIWRQLIESALSTWGLIWISSWPTILIAMFGAWILTRSLVRPAESDPDEDRGASPPRVPGPIYASALLVWASGALLPMLAMFITLSDRRALLYFWKLESGAMKDSGLLAMGTGAIALLVALLVAYSLGSPARGVRRMGAMSVMILCVMGLIPGVLIGAAVARAPMTTLSAGWMGALLASCMRASFLGAIMGALGASSESLERKSTRWQLAGGSLGGWLRAVLPSISMPMLGAGLIAALYSMYEIEASVMVRPPGMENLPQQLLSDLHYARLEQLSAAGINLLALGLVASIVASLLISRVGPRRA